MRSLVQGETNKIYQEYRAIKYRTQVVNGTNYLIKVNNVVILVLKRNKKVSDNELNEVWHLGRHLTLFLHFQQHEIKMKIWITSIFTCLFPAGLCWRTQLHSSVGLPSTSLLWRISWAERCTGGQNPRRPPQTFLKLNTYRLQSLIKMLSNDSSQCCFTIHHFTSWMY